MTFRSFVVTLNKESKVKPEGVWCPHHILREMTNHCEKPSVQFTCHFIQQHFAGLNCDSNNYLFSKSDNICIVCIRPSAACCGRTCFLKSNCGSSSRSKWAVLWSSSESIFRMVCRSVRISMVLFSITAKQCTLSNGCRKACRQSNRSSASVSEWTLYILYILYFNKIWRFEISSALNPCTDSVRHT